MMRSLAPLCLTLAALTLAACTGGPKPSTIGYQVKEGEQNASGAYKIGKPYQIQGVWYYPQVDYSYDETGIASWYGADYHGKVTANGEAFNPDEVTAAHRTLPMPSLVKVTNLDNGRMILVRINDRGPFTHGRILDLSKKAAELLDIDLKGTARVRVQIMQDESRLLAYQAKGYEQAPLEAAPVEKVTTENLATPAGARSAPQKSKGAKPLPAPAPAAASNVEIPDLENQTVYQQAARDTQLYIQAGAFSRFDNANRLSVSLSSIGSTTVSQVHGKTGSIFRVRMGPMASLSDADAMLEKVISSGYPDAKIVVD
jgi:rare lipoprotein A